MVLPEWYSKAEKKLQDAIDDICRKHDVDWTFAHDSQTIQDSLGSILNTLLRISEQVNNPFQHKLTEEEKKELKGTGKKR